MTMVMVLRGRPRGDVVGVAPRARRLHERFASAPVSVAVLAVSRRRN